MTSKPIKKLAIGILGLLSVASFIALIIVPVTVIGWLMLKGAWSALGFCVLSIFYAALLTLLTLMFGGLLGQLGMIFIPVLAAAYAQYDFLNSARESLPAEHQQAFAIFSVLIGLLPLMNLGKGEESAPGVMSMHGILALLVGAAAWLHYTGTIYSYWHFVIIYLAGGIIGFIISAMIGKSAES